MVKGFNWLWYTWVQSSSSSFCSTDQSNTTGWLKMKHPAFKLVVVYMDSLAFKLVVVYMDSLAFKLVVVYIDSLAYVHFLNRSTQYSWLVLNKIFCYISCI